MQSKPAYVVDAVRSAVGRAGKGSLRAVRPEAMGAEVLSGLLARYPSVGHDLIEDVLI